MSGYCPTDFSEIRHSAFGLILRLRSVADSECQYDPWLANLCAQSADEIERLSAKQDESLENREKEA